MATWKMAVVGLESRDKALLETAIDLASGFETGRWELVDDQQVAQAIIANIDVPDGQNISEGYKSGQTSTFIVPYSSTANLENNAELTLSSPLSYKNVTSLLKNLESELVSPKIIEAPTKREVTEKITPLVKPSLIPEVEINPVDIVKHKIDWLSDSADDIDKAPFLTEITSSSEVYTPDNIEILESTNELSLSIPTSVSFMPDSRLLGLVLKIIKSGKTTQISHSNYPDLRIFPENGWFVFVDDLDSHPEMFRESADSFLIEALEEEIKDELFSGRLPQSLWKLLYTAALFGSEGRLLAHLDPEEPFSLLHTPYFGMIPHTSDHITIADFMVDNNSSIETISNSASMEIETVIDFCNACDAIQLLKSGEQSGEIKTDFTDYTKIEDDTTIESVIVRDTEKPKKSGLINSLWSSLTRSS